MSNFACLSIYFGMKKFGRRPLMLFPKCLVVLQLCGDCALINGARGSYEELFVLTLKMFVLNVVNEVHTPLRSEQIFPVSTELSLKKSFLYMYTNRYS